MHILVWGCLAFHHHHHLLLPLFIRCMDNILSTASREKEEREKTQKKSLALPCMSRTIGQIMSNLIVQSMALPWIPTTLACLGNGRPGSKAILYKKGQSTVRSRWQSEVESVRWPQCVCGLRLHVEQHRERLSRTMEALRAWMHMDEVGTDDKAN